MALKLSDLASLSASQIDETHDFIPVFDNSADVLKKAAVNSITASGISSFNGRTGDVLPADDDYSIDQISASGSLGQVPVLNSQGELEMMNPPVSAPTAQNVSVDHPSGTNIPAAVSNLQSGLEDLFQNNLNANYSNDTLVFSLGQPS